MKQRVLHYFTTNISTVFFFAVLLNSYYSQAQQHNINLNGKIIDKKTRLPLSGATVHIKGTTHEVLTDEAGEFHFLTGQTLPVTYLITYVGYQNLEVTQTESEHFIFNLEPANSQLGEVVVVGYGKQKKEDVTGSIVSVSKKALDQPVSSLDQLLKGTAAGVQVTQTSGQPGGGISIRIRGGTSVQGG